MNQLIENSADEIEKTEEQYEYEREQIELMFPDAKFEIAIDLEYFDDIITERNNIVIKHDYGCYCYDNCKRKTDWFFITGEKLTYKYVIGELIRQKLVLDCNHRFVEGFYKHPKSNCQFEIWVGS